MLTAVIRSGGKQYRVSQGDTIRVDKLPGDPGKKIQFDQVLMVGGDSPKIGKPLVGGAKVEGEIVAQGRAGKVIVFKFRRRKKHHKKQGHRQDFTAVKITDIKS
jgi:large subunit ribosomal protein L21